MTKSDAHGVSHVVCDACRREVDVRTAEGLSEYAQRWSVRVGEKRIVHHCPTCVPLASSLDMNGQAAITSTSVYVSVCASPLPRAARERRKAVFLEALPGEGDSEAYRRSRKGVRGE